MLGVISGRVPLEPSERVDGEILKFLETHVSVDRVGEKRDHRCEPSPHADDETGVDAQEATSLDHAVAKTESPLVEEVTYRYLWMFDAIGFAGSQLAAELWILEALRELAAREAQGRC